MTDNDHHEAGSRGVLPRCIASTTVEAVLGDIRALLCAPAVTALVSAFGGTPAPAAPLDDYLAWLDDFAARHWDFRAGRERHDTAAADLSTDLRIKVEAAARWLGMTPVSAPPAGLYDHVLILGGSAASCRQRALFAAALLDGDVTAGNVAGLASLRPLSRQELPSEAERTEVDAMRAAVVAAMDLPEPTFHEATDQWSVTGWQPREHRAGVTVLAAPSSEPTVRRANTADTYHFWADRAAPRPGERILLVTTAIFVPFRHCDAVRMLGLALGCTVDTVGLDSSTVGPAGLHRTYTPSMHLQEIRSVIRSALALCRATLGTW